MKIKRLENTFVKDSNILIQLNYLFFWRFWIPFRSKVLLNCEYCGKGFFMKKRMVGGFTHQLGDISATLIRIHNKCAIAHMKFERWYFSGEVADCIDCKRKFYLKNKVGEDCPVKGMAQSHRIKGEENLRTI